MQSETIERYLYDLGHLLKSKAIEAASERDHGDAGNRSFLSGLALGYINVLNLMVDRADAFGIDPAALHLTDFEPDSLH